VRGKEGREKGIGHRKKESGGKVGEEIQGQGKKRYLRRGVRIGLKEADEGLGGKIKKEGGAGEEEGEGGPPLRGKKEIGCISERKKKRRKRGRDR